MKQNYRGFTLSAKRDRSLGGDTLLYYFIARKADGWFLNDAFTTGDETPAEYMPYLRKQVDDYYLTPLEYGSPDDVLIVREVVEELLYSFTPEQIGEQFKRIATEIAEMKKQAVVR